MPLDVGWIGLGRMGMPMARRVLAADHRLHVWSRDRARTTPILERGAAWASGPEDLVRLSRVILTIVSDPDDVRELHDRMLPRAQRDSVFIDMTTASPKTAETSTALAASLHVNVIDAPVTGGVTGATQGTLTAFCGGDESVISSVRPLLDAFCTRVIHCGGPGAGYRMKLVNQTMVAGTLLGLANGAALARRFAFDAAQVSDALRDGSASGRLFESYVARMMTGNGTPSFTLGLLRKDIRLARDEAARSGSTAFHDFVLRALEDACARHGEGAGVQCLAFE